MYTPLHSWAHKLLSSQQTKSISETVDRKLSAAPGVAYDHDAEDDLKIDIRTEVPGKESFRNAKVMIVENEFCLVYEFI